MEQEIESAGAKENDSPRDKSEMENPAEDVDKTVADEVADSAKTSEDKDEVQPPVSAVDEEHDSSDPKSREVAESIESQEVDKNLELAKSSSNDDDHAEDILEPEKEKTPLPIACTELDNSSLNEEKSEPPGVLDTPTSTEGRKTPESPSERIPNLRDDTTSETPAEETTSVRSRDSGGSIEEKVSNEPAVESSSEEIVGITEEKDAAESPRVEEPLPDPPILDKSGELTIDEAAEAETEKGAEAEAGKEAEGETRKEAQAETGKEAEVETGKEAEVETGKEAEAETGKEAEGETGKEAEAEIENKAESPPIEENVPSKITESENFPDTLDPPGSETKKSGDDSKSDTESASNEADASSKEIATEKQMVEPENTEFVQISQDKQDDGGNEGQSIDAEDPFGGDNLTADNVEQTDVDSRAADDINFHKLGDQAVNLQDVVNAKDQACREFVTEDSNPDEITESNADNAEITAAESSERSTELEVASAKLDTSSKDKSTAEVETREKRSEEKPSGEPMSVESSNEPADDDGKKKDGAAPMETEESPSTVLPGQDDELCIIPDSMKETTSTRRVADKTVEDKTADVIMEQPTNDKDDEIEVEKEIIKSKDLEIVSSAGEPMLTDGPKSVGGRNKDRKKDERASNAKKSSASAATTDVIDVDEEMKNSEIDEVTISQDPCKQCKERKPCNINVKLGSDTFSVCSEVCKTAFNDENIKSMDIPSDLVNSKREKRCASCLLIVETSDERNLSWETMEFCNEECLGKFQTKYGSYCRNCNGSVQPISLGKYCVRFGYDVRQFCCSSCLEEFKKGLKVCSYCQKDISSGIEGFLAPVGDKGQFKDFCTQYCMEKYSRMNSSEPPIVERKSCGVCQEVKVVHCEVQIDRATPVAICSDPCFAAFKFVNKVDPEQCSTCKKFFELANKKSFVVFYEAEAHTFCTKTCLNIFIITNRKIVPCNWCKVKKYNFDMIKKDLKTGQALMMCSLNCLTLYQVSVNAVSAKRISCDFCKEFSQAQYHLTMSDATIRNFCSYNCVMKFQGQYTKSPITIPAGDDPVPTGTPKRTYPPAKSTLQTVQKPSEMTSKKALPVISSVTSLASLTSNGQVSQAPPQQQQSATINNVNVAASVVTTQSQSPQVIVNQQVITRPPSPVKIHNKVTQCKPVTHTKGVSVRPHPCYKSTQTEGDARILIPIPVPIYVPFPVHMWSMPFPVPVPFPLPIPVPVFIPTTRNSAKGIFKDIKRIQEKIPADPFEAELLMMAEMVATEKKANETDSESSDDNGRDTAEAVDSSNTFGEDMLQMALKMATGELDEPAVDLETALTPNTITATQTTSQTDSSMSSDVQPERNVTASNRGKKRMVPYKPRGAPSKRGRRISGVHENAPMMPPPESQTSAQPRMMEPIEKPDANMALKYTFGVNAWRQWVIAKNAELEKQAIPPRKVKLFKTDLLQLTADELNYTLCLFVKEVRKPNGAEYAPDTIYYLCLGIQEYLFENNRIDNIFTDSYYEKFTDCLNEVAKKFSVLYNEAQYIVTRVEEEHLWECKQLGAHSPHVLLSTLMFFNTKHFNLVTVEEHMQLSFSHIMKHWKRNPAAQAAAASVPGKGPGSRNVLLRFYPPQSALEANSRKKKVYEQQENEENPLRCPVKLYEFYLSKCPESVKTRNDVFYLLPERSCVPDSPVWYSTSALAKEHLVKMLYRVKMVKEINVALLTS